VAALSILPNFSIFGLMGKYLIGFLLAAFSLACSTSFAQAGFHQASKSLAPTAEFENVSVRPLFSDAHASGFVIWIKQKVGLHKHASHSETVYILEGKGEMRLGDETFVVKPGDVIFIPEGTPHAVTVTKGVMKVISIQAPQFDGSDRILLD
jgi:quercetin dioxygenase-like cupin family protein